MAKQEIEQVYSSRLSVTKISGGQKGKTKKRETGKRIKRQPKRKNNFANDAADCPLIDKHAAIFLHISQMDLVICNRFCSVIDLSSPQAFAPIMVAVFCDEGGQVAVKYSSDRLADTKATLSIEAWLWDGSVTFNRTMTVTLQVRRRIKGRQAIV